MTSESTSMLRGEVITWHSTNIRKGSREEPCGNQDPCPSGDRSQAEAWERKARRPGDALTKVHASSRCRVPRLPGGHLKTPARLCTRVPATISTGAEPLSPAHRATRRPSAVERSAEWHSMEKNRHRCRHSGEFLLQGQPRARHKRWSAHAHNQSVV